MTSFYNLIKLFIFLVFSLFPTLSFSQFSDPNPLTYLTYIPNSAKSADLDGDGDQDIAVAIKNNGRILWYENLGGGNFSKQHMLNNMCCSNTESIFLGDIDLDSDIDVVVSTGIMNDIIWIENQGNGNFDAFHFISTIANGSSSVYAADLDGDGDLDALSSSGNDDKIAWYENTGVGTGVFGSQQVLSNQVNNAIYVYSDDLDNDGDFDVLGLSPTDGDLLLFENLGGLNFGPSQILSSQMSNCFSIKTADLDQNGFNDILVSIEGGNGRIAWLPTSAGLSFSVEQSINSNTINARDVHTFDLDLDGDQDVITCINNNASGTNLVDSILVYENLGFGTFNSSSFPVTAIPQYGSIAPYSVYADDLDGDGYGEIIFAYGGNRGNNIMWSKNLNSFNFAPAIPLTFEAYNPTSLWTTDLDGDSDLDLLSTSKSDGKVAWYPNQNGLLGDQVEIQLFPNNLNKLITADFDYDGDQDIVVGTNDSTLWYLENIGAGGFNSPLQIASNCYSTNDMFVADLDNDSDIDLLTVSKIDDKVALYTNLGGGTFGPQVVLSATMDDPRGISAFDFDGDNDIDVVATAFIDDELFWIENLGGGTFGTPTTIDYLNGPTDVVHADIDDDGLLDILCGASLSNKVVWYKNIGSGIYSSALFVTNEFDDYDELKAEDFDNDSDIDILIIASTTNYANLSWIENIGNGNFGPVKLIDDFHFTGTSIEVADFNNDGDNDIVAASSSKNHIAWYENQNISEFQVRGNLYVDMNQNQQFDTLDYPFPQIGVSSTSNIIGNHIYNDGRYFFNYDTTGTAHTIIPGTIQYWGLVSDSSSYSFTTNVGFVSIENADFGFFPDSIVDLLEVDLVGGFSRCDDTVNYWVNLSNIGSSIPHGVLEVVLDDSISYFNSIILPDSIQGNSIYWNFDSLYYYSSYQITFEAILPGVDSLNSNLYSILHVHIMDSLNNITSTLSDSIVQILMCSYDPNDKISDPMGMGTQGYISPDLENLEYTIRFQNTGNDTAYVIQITDQLSTNLNWDSFSFLSSSDFNFYELDSSGLLTITFNNINLPDSTSDFLGSQGYFKYRIGIDSSLSIGTQILNTASIYFDNNPPIVTNTKINTIYGCQQNLNGVLSQSICKYETLNIDAGLDENIYIWEIPNIASGYSNEILWIADTSGTFNLNIQVSNEVCQKDTVVSVTVTPGIVPQIIDTTTICFGESTLIFGQMENQTGQYTEIHQGSNGCDSILIKQLFVLPEIPVTTIDTSYICQGDSISIFNNYENSAGTFFNILVASTGCDSIVSKLVVLYPDYSSPTYSEISLCFGSSTTVFGEVVNSSGSFTDTLSTLNGCDSIIGINVTVEPMLIAPQYDSISICLGDSALIFNQYLQTAGSYTDTIQSVQGCDSIVGIDLYIFSTLVQFTIIIQDTLCVNWAPVALSGSTPPGGTYSGNGISGYDFIPSSAGIGFHTLNYSYTDTNGCISSDDHSIYVDGCVEINEQPDLGIQLYPNPFSDYVILELPLSLSGSCTVRIYNNLGNLIFRKANVGTTTKIDNDWLGSGIYYLELNDSESGEKIYMSKLFTIN